MNIDISNAHCGSGPLRPEPRPPQCPLASINRRTARPPVPVLDPDVARRVGPDAERRLRDGIDAVLSVLFVGALLLRSGASAVAERPAVRPGRTGAHPLRAPPSVATLGVVRLQARSAGELTTIEARAAQPKCRGPEFGRDYPLNLSISVSGGKETNQDSPSNGE